jgi:hypothetical protein
VQLNFGAKPTGSKREEQPESQVCPLCLRPDGLQRAHRSNLWVRLSALQPAIFALGCFGIPAPADLPQAALPPRQYGVTLRATF